MKKSTILSFATVAAISVTTIGSYAAWDTLSSTATGDFKVSDTYQTVTGAISFDDGVSSGDEYIYTGTTAVEINTSGSSASSLKLTPVAKSGDTVLTAEEVRLQVTQTGSTLTPDGDSVIDNTVTTGNANTNLYTVTATILDKTLAGSTVTVELTAALTK